MQCGGRAQRAAHVRPGLSILPFFSRFPQALGTCGQSGRRESLVPGHASSNLVEDASHSLDRTTPAPLCLHPQGGWTSGGQTPSQSSSLLSSQQGWGVPKLKVPLSLPQLHPALEAAGAGLACPSSARPGVGGQEQQLGPGTHTALVEEGKSGESQRKSPFPTTVDYGLLSMPPGQC